MNTRKILAWCLVIGMNVSVFPLAQAQLVPPVPADTTPPIISNITVNSVTLVACVVVWTTNEATDSQIEYGTTSGYGLQTTVDASLGIAHVQTFIDLSAGTTYHFRVKSKDVAGNLSTSSDQTCTTEAAVTTSSSSSSSSIFSSSSITVEVSSSSSTQTDIFTQPVTTETSSAAAAASSSVSSILANLDTTGPVVSNVTISATTTVGTAIAWTTDEVADSQIEYGLTDVYGFETSLNLTLGTAHIQTLIDLEPGTDYHYRVKSKDTVGNVTISEDHVFTTASASIVIDTPPAILTQSVISITPSGVTLLWTTNEIANSQVEYGLTTDYGSHRTIDASLALEHAVSIDNLESGTTYHYRIKTTDSAGQTTYSGDDTFTTESLTVTVEPTPNISVPLSIANIEASALTSSSALLVWTTSTLADSQVEYGLTTSYSSHTTIDVSVGLAHAVLLSGLAANTTYHYRVKSRDAQGNLVTSNDQTFTTLAAPPASVSISTPPVISEVTVSRETSTATIVWTTDKIANSQVEYGLTDAYGSESTLNGTFANTHTIVLSNLETGTTYHYRIRTTDAGGRLTLGEDNTFTTAAPSSGSSSVTLPSISEVEESALTASSALITWTTSVGANAQVEYGLTTSYGSQSTLDGSLSLSHTSLIEGLSPDTTYHYRVRSIDALGNHVLSGDQDFTTLELPTDQTAPLISGVTVSSVGTTRATITWTTDDASTSRVQYGETTAYGVYTNLVSNPATSHSATITGLFPDTTYNFTVQSEDSAGNTAISVNHTFRTEPAPFASGTMSVPVVSHITDTSITLSWNVPFDDSAGTEFYDIRYSTEPITQYNFEDATPAREGVEHIVHVSENGQSTEHIYMIVELQPGTSYYFGIKSGASRATLAHLEETLPNLSAQSTSSASSIGIAQNNRSGAPIVNRNEGVRSTSGGGGGAGLSTTQGASGGKGGYRRLPAPRSMQAQVADSEVAFVWNSPLRSPLIHTDIVRKEGGFPTSPTDGQVIYEGRDETFTDTNLTNGKKYHYAIFTHNDGVAAHAYSAPVLVAMIPTDGMEQVIVREIPSATAPALPIAHDLQFGMKNAEVKALQQWLANDSSLYPEGFTTGYFGPLTQAAVKRLQQKYGLPQTGVVDSATRNAMPVGPKK